MAKLMVLLSVYLSAISIMAVEVKNKDIVWKGENNLTKDQKKQYEQQAFEVLKKAGHESAKFVKAFAMIEPLGREQHPKCDTVLVDFWCENESVRIWLFHPFKKEISSYCNYTLDGRTRQNNEPPLCHTTNEVIAKAIQIAKVVGNVDLSTPQWKVHCQGRVNENWEIIYLPVVSGYVAMFDGGSIRLADDKNLSLVSYSNSTYEFPKVEKTEVKLSSEDARKRSDEFLKTYYKREVHTLEFGTNMLEIVRPNYAFMPQFKDYSGSTNAPVLVWTSHYNRKKNTTIQTDVVVYIDAADGSMLGGYD